MPAATTQGVLPLSDANPRLIYDVGLHLGEDTDYYLKKGFDVVAFEANPELVDLCKKRFQDAIVRGQLRIVAGAIAPPSADDRILFYKNPISIWGTVEEGWARRNALMGYPSENIAVPRVDIVEAYRSYGIPFYLKIDVEGVDRLVLEGLKQFDARPRYVSIESEKVDFSALRGDLALLRSLGYTRFKPVQQETIPGTTIKTRTLDGDEIEHTFEWHASGPFGEDIAQAWLGLEDTLRECRIIFRRYRLFGDSSLFSRIPSERIRSGVEGIYRGCTGYQGPLPGWHDIHAGL
jgi:FkbM family methyltransferase